MKLKSSLIALPAAALVCGLAAAQTRTESPPPESVIDLDGWSAYEEGRLREQITGADELGEMTYVANSHLLGGEPVSVGATWKATYAEDGMTFTPALGKEAPHTRQLTYRFRSVEVGGSALSGLAHGVPATLEDGAVVYHRGAGLTEVYEARQGGLEQSFLLETLPGRSGDLVVRGELATDLVAEAPAMAGESLRFREPGRASVSVDKVVAVDADGDRVEGSLRFAGSELEIVIPAAFVAQADLPLLVDPLFGVEYEGTDGSFEADQVDIAFGASFFDEYAIVFCRYFSATDPDIYAATYTNTGVSGLSLFAIESDIGTFDQEPSIAYNVGEEQFAVAWQRSNTPSDPNDILFTTFDASNGIVESRISLASGDIVDENHPDVGGEDQTGFDRVVVVYQAENQIRVASVRVPDGATPVLQVTNTVFSGGNHDYPAISKSGGVNGRYFVVAEDDFGSDRDLAFGVVTDLGSVLPGSDFLTTIGPDEERPDIAGDGDQGMVVFQREDTAGDGDNDIIARKLTYTVSTLTLDSTEIIVEGDAADDEIEPAIGLSGNEYLIAYADQIGTVYDVYASTVGVATCLECEPQTLVSTAIFSNREPEVGSRQAGGDFGQGEAGIAFTRVSTSGNDQIYFHPWENDGGGSTASFIGSGCGLGGSINFSGSTSIGSTDFSVNLTSADGTSTLGILNLNFPGGEFLCGSCIVLPIKFLFTQVTTRGPFGTKQASQPFQIPCKGVLAGKTVAFQWIVLPSVVSPCPLGPNISLSNRAQLTLGF